MIVAESAGLERDAAPARRSRVRGVLVPVVIVVVSLAVTLIALEVAVRILSPQAQFTCSVNTWDRVVGTRQVPGAKGFVIVPEYAVDLVINSKGLRDREFAYPKPQGVKRILVLGDSFTCGYGVQAEDTYAKVLERMLNADSSRAGTWEVINAGVGSTGTANQLAFFETEGYRYSPDLVILGFFQNDYTDNVVSRLYTLDGGLLTKHDAATTVWRSVQQVVRVIPGYRTIFARSHLLNFTKVRIARRHYRSLGVRYDPPPGEADRNLQGLEITQALIVALRDACTRNSCALTVMMIPKIDYSDWTQRTVRLLDYLASQNIAAIDLMMDFRNTDAAGVPVSYPEDHHWNRAGHRLAAEILYKHVKADSALQAL